MHPTAHIFLAASMSAGLMLACGSEKKNTETHLNNENTRQEGTFGFDLEFLEKHKPVILLSAPDRAEARAIVIADYQGRVMTTTASGDDGNSYGWINYNLIKSGKTTPHMNAFGGEERIWLAPEGGQYSVYFQPGQKFEFENWQTPAAIDSEPFDIVSQDSSSVMFQKRTHQVNYLGTKLDITLRRKVLMLSRGRIKENLAIELDDDIKYVGYETRNEIINEGADWSDQTGLLGIWILGMFRPSERTTIVAPVDNRVHKQPLLTADYFGTVPPERLKQSKNAIFLKADGKFRSKIGLQSGSSTSIAGSYDALKGVLTIVQFDNDPGQEYLKSTWKVHDNPLGGDVFNAYNDGPLEDGSQMGPFFELESSSSVKALRNKEILNHTHRTFHFEGNRPGLNRIAEKLLGFGLEDIEKTF